ncbi:UNVERIFIED_CONTAM: hypothetical protein GTU68_000436 [Idotea baltica]|nr:hypothetical protein [Idotea baltica]
MGKDVSDGETEFWALREVDFNIEFGEVVGIIGKNGAGKSTLLKVVSKITPPTSGRITLNGRVASLLEVGTGFHPELSGRENIFLNGSILGMTRTEIKQKFDEIVDFSGVEKFLDTPVKRYSSGMYVRLAFAVAAHLEPEILVIDEVLAVGDAEFQKKCLGKMNDVAGEGRAVLFVSHNMAAVKALCTRGILLGSGQIVKNSTVDEVILSYLSQNSLTSANGIVDTRNLKRTEGKFPAIKKVWIENQQGKPATNFLMGERVKICYEFESDIEISNPGFGFGIETNMGNRIFSLNNYTSQKKLPKSAQKGIAEFSIDELILIPGSYRLTVSLVQDQSEWIDFIEQALSFTVEPSDVYGTGKMPKPSRGLVYARGKVGLRETEFIKE